MFDMIWLRVND